MVNRLVPVELRESEDNDDPLLQEGATAKAKVLAAARSIDDVLAAKDVDDDTKTAARSLRAVLRKKWAELSGAKDAPPAPAPPAPATEAAIDGAYEAVPLEEARKGGREFDVRIIRPGWGSSGYYSATTLQKAAEAKVFPSGLKMFWNHPTKTEERERPERNLRDLAGTLRADARWEANGPEGPGLYAPVRVTEQYAGSVAELAEHIGVSIRAAGAAREGEADGRRGRIIEAITGAKSVDFVTAPGAGGRIIGLFEAARPDNSKEEEAMELKEAQAAMEAAEARAKAAEERVAALEESARRAGEMSILAEAKAHVASKLAQRKLPEMTVARLSEAAIASAKAGTDGKLDIPALDAKLDETVRAEVAYLESVFGKGRVSGMGGGEGPAGNSGNDAEALKEADAKLDAALASLGLSEAERKVAVAGRY